MHFNLSLVAFYSLALVATATTLSASDPSYSYPVDTSQPASTSQPTPGDYCAPHSAAAQLLRLYSPSRLDHLYTTNITEANNVVETQGFTREGATGLVFPSSATGTVPLYRLYNATIFDHFYTVSAAGVDFAVQVAGYTLEGVAGYVYPSPQCGAVPLYRVYSAQQTDHFYTTSIAERDSAIKGGYSDEGIDGYIIPV